MIFNAILFVNHFGNLYTILSFQTGNLLFPRKSCSIGFLSVGKYTLRSQTECSYFAICPRCTCICPRCTCICPRYIPLSPDMCPSFTHISVTPSQRFWCVRSFILFICFLYYLCKCFYIIFILFFIFC